MIVRREFEIHDMVEIGDCWYSIIDINVSKQTYKLKDVSCPMMISATADEMTYIWETHQVGHKPVGLKFVS